MKSLLTLAFAILAFMPSAKAMDGHEMPMKDKMSMEETVPVVKAVVFYSDSCGACKVLKPKMMKAVQAINMGKIDMVKLDFTSKETIEKAKALAEEKNVTPILQKFGAKTGFVTLVNKDGEIVEKLNASDSVEDIAVKLAKSIVEAS